jgi:hypothetical protein
VEVGELFGRRKGMLAILGRMLRASFGGRGVGGDGAMATVVGVAGCASRGSGAPSITSRAACGACAVPGRTPWAHVAGLRVARSGLAGIADAEGHRSAIGALNSGPGTLRGVELCAAPPCSRAREEMAALNEW